jgi:ribosome-binding factor A
MSLRTDKFASTVRHALGEIFLHDLDNPDFKFISIALVDVTPDLKRARVAVSSFLPKVNLLEELQAASGIIRSRLGKRMYLKYVPELVFVLDTAFELDQKLAVIDKENRHETRD